MKILTLCPSIHPHKYRDMMTSFYKTSTEDNDLVVEKSGTVTEAFNKYFEHVELYDFVHLTNDDVVYQTQGWDSLFLAAARENGPGVYYGDDRLQGKNLPTFPFISSAIIKQVGFLQLPSLYRYCGDVVWRFIATSCNCLHYCPQIIIEHRWEGADEAINKADMMAFANWLPVSYRAINKVKEIL